MKLTSILVVMLAAALAGASSALAEAPADSELLDEGASYSTTFHEEGTFAYHCHPHPYMTGAVVVSDEPDALDGEIQIAIRDYAFVPDHVVVRPGATVTWTNEDPVPHTVTFERANESHGHEPVHDEAAMDDHGNATMDEDMHGVDEADGHMMGDGVSDDEASSSVPSVGPVATVVAVAALAFATRRRRA